MKLYRCHSDTTKCILIDENGERNLFPWRAEIGELYATEFDDFPKDGLIRLYPTKGAKGNRTKRIPAKISIEISALIFKRCFEKANNMWRLDGG